MKKSPGGLDTWGGGMEGGYVVVVGPVLKHLWERQEQSIYIMFQ